MVYDPLVLIAEKTELLFEALYTCVQRIAHHPAIVHVSTTGDLADALKHVDDYALVVLDADLARGKDLSLSPEVLSSLGKVPSTVLVSKVDEKERDVAIANGINAYLPKSAPSPVIIAGLALALCGYSFYPMPAAAGVSESERKAVYQSTIIGKQPAVVKSVTPRQLDVLLLLSEGCSNAEIARRLNLAEPTVRLHLRAAYRRLGVSNRVQAVRETLRMIAKEQ